MPIVAPAQSHLRCLAPADVPSNSNRREPKRMPRRRGRCALADVEDDGLMCVRPEQRHAANARERARMRVLARAFCRLKTTLPWVPADTKLSKLDTLRLAASYIAHLRAILTDEPAPAQAQHPLNLTWPFTFNQQGTRPGGEWSGDSKGRGLDQLDHGGRPSSSASSSCGDAELEDDDYYAPHFSDSLLHLV